MDPIEELKEKKILLLSGGWSAEREVSIRSGAAVSAALDRLSIGYTHIDLSSERDAKNLSEEYDLAFIALHGREEKMDSFRKFLSQKILNIQGATLVLVKLLSIRSKLKKYGENYYYLLQTSLR